MYTIAARIPRYSLHKATGQARVCIDGRDHYLGPYNSPESKAEYSRLIDTWQLRRKARRNAGLTIGELVLLYDVHVASYYQKNGKPTSKVHIVKSALKPLVAGYARVPAIDFGPRDLKAVREGTTNLVRMARQSACRRLLLFSPAEAEQERLAALHEARKTPLSCGNRPGSNKADEPEKQPGDHYTTAAYGRSIARACKAVNAERREKNANRGEDEAEQPMIEIWRPNRLRQRRP